MQERILKLLQPRALLQFAGLALGLNLLIEILAHRSLTGTIVAILTHPFLFLLGTMMIALTLSVSGLFRHRYFALFLLATIWLGLGIANCVLMVIRNSPLCGMDFYIITTGITILTVYLTTLQIILISICILLAIGGFVVLYRKIAKSPIPLRAALVQIGTTALSTLLLTLIVQGAKLVPRQFDNMNEAYDNYGFVYCFTQTIFDRGIDMPEGYTDAGIRAILSILSENAEQTAPPSELPNLLIVQLESFFDISAVEHVTFSDEPTPYFNQLKAQNPSGFLTVPSVGGGTANTEFEVLTGMDLSYFGIGEFPYNTVLREQTLPSLAYQLKELGYANEVFHNHEGSFYDRYLVYPNLGFDTFTSIEYMSDYEQNILGWCDDSVLTKEMMESMKSTAAPDFLFAVSVQCHGKYPAEYETPRGGIEVEGIEDLALAAQYRYYANQLHEVDDFVRELTSALEAYDEPVILVLYGDHLPSLNLTEADLPDYQSLYQTEYIIWSNTQTLPAVRMDLDACQLGARALDCADIHNGAITCLHQTSSDQHYYRDWLHALQYDAVYGNALSTDGQYAPTEMKMGRRTASVISAWNTEEGLYIFGTDFTAHSKVLINGWQKETERLSPLLLRVKSSSIGSGDRITIAQVSGSQTVLSLSKEFIYTEADEI